MACLLALLCVFCASAPRSSCGDEPRLGADANRTRLRLHSSASLRLRVELFLLPAEARAEDARPEAGQDAHDDRERGGQRQPQLQRFPGARLLHRLRARLLEVHRDDHAQVVVGGDGAVDHADDGQPGPAAADRGAEDEELAEEARQRRHAAQAKHEDRHQEGQQRLPSGEPTRDVACVASSPTVRSSVMIDGKGAHVHEGVGEEVEERGVGALPPCRAPGRPGCSRRGRCSSRPACA